MNTPTRPPGAGTIAAVPPCVLVTRPQPQASQWVARLQALGLCARALPLLAIGEPADPAAVGSAWWLLQRLDLAMFVSPSAVQHFFARRPPGMVWPGRPLAAGTGPGTQAALVQAGVPAERIVSPPAAGGRFDSETLWPLLAERRDWRGAGALIVRGEGGREWLADTLRQHGATVHFVEAYRRTAPVLDEATRTTLAEAVATPAAHCWLFSSSEAVRQLPALAPGVDWSASRALATHPRIAEAARAIGFVNVERVEPLPESVAASLTPSIQSARP